MESKLICIIHIALQKYLILVKVVRLTRPLWEVFCAGTALATPGGGLLTHEARSEAVQ